MDRSEARDQLKENLTGYVESITQHSKGVNMYVCPLCGSGTGGNGTGAFSIKDGISWKCFSCGQGGDIFDLIGKVEGLGEYPEQLQRAGELFGISIDSNPAPRPEYHNPAKTERKTDKAIHIKAYTETQPEYLGFFLLAHDRIKDTDYPQRRGLSTATVDRFKLGYVERWTHPNAPNAPASPRLIVPTSPNSYFARDTREHIPEEQKAFAKSKVGSVQLFNKKALQEADQPIFIVEGELDALSIFEVGGEAVALGSAANKNALIALLEREKPSQPLIVALDNDVAGEKAGAELMDALKALDIKCFQLNPYGDAKDANEALMRNRKALTATIAGAKTIQNEADRARKEKYLQTAAIYHIQGFVDGIAESVNTPFVPTGFPKLDTTLDGGLYEGLYIMGAISSLGKTTLIAQIADQIAQAGTDVLIFSLEMARSEIMAKSISRHTLQLTLAAKGDTRNAKTARGITTGKRYDRYSKTETELIKEAVNAYSAYAQHLFISEGVGDIGAPQIRQTVEEHILFTGHTPIVIIDYLQILSPYNERYSDKQNTDKAVLELKRISRDFKLPIIGISSFNRANYKVAVTMEAFKESGAIEYSSDILMGLQLEGAGKDKFDVDEAKKKNPREVELVILKNRNGPTGDKLGFRYYPLFNYFQEK